MREVMLQGVTETKLAVTLAEELASELEIKKWCAATWHVKARILGLSALRSCQPTPPPKRQWT
jgi:hypothetical protein